jgi:hypothetical protein
MAVATVGFRCARAAMTPAVEAACGDRVYDNCAEGYLGLLAATGGKRSGPIAAWDDERKARS